MRILKFIAENVLNWEFYANTPNQKWLTDLTEFKYYIDLEKHKVYLSAILDLYDRRIMSYVIRDNNNNALVFDTFDNAIANWIIRGEIHHLSGAWKSLIRFVGNRISVKKEIALSI